jgi:hypothetical protein
MTGSARQTAGLRDLGKGTRKRRRKLPMQLPTFGPSSTQNQGPFQGEDDGYDSDDGARWGPDFMSEMVR